jgi:hypothetical protein
MERADERVSTAHSLAGLAGALVMTATVATIAIAAEPVGLDLCPRGRAHDALGPVAAAPAVPDR